MRFWGGPRGSCLGWAGLWLELWGNLVAVRPSHWLQEGVPHVCISTLTIWAAWVTRSLFLPPLQVEVPPGHGLYPLSLTGVSLAATHAQHAWPCMAQIHLSALRCYLTGRLALMWLFSCREDKPCSHSPAACLCSPCPQGVRWPHASLSPPRSPWPGHADELLVEAGAVSNQQEQSWARVVDKDSGHEWLWGMRMGRADDIP